MSAINLTFSWPASNIGTPRTVTVEIYNGTASKIPACRLFVLANTYWAPNSVAVPEIKAWETAKVSVTVKTQGGVSWDHLCDTLTTELKDGSTIIKKASVWDQFYFYNPVQYLSKYQHPIEDLELSIYLVGPAGSGKSALLTTIMTLLSKSKEVAKNVTAVGGMSTHVTTRLRRHELKGLNASIYDTWGLTEDSYITVKFKDIIKGKIPNGWEMDRELNTTLAAKAQESKQTRRAHAVMFLIPCGTLDIEKTMTALQGNFADLIKEDISPIVVLARVDEHVEGFRGNPRAKNEALDKLIDKAATKLNIPKNRIYVSLPYTDEQERKFHLDYLAFKLLDCALKSAQEYLVLASGQIEDSDEEMVKELTLAKKRVEEAKKKKNQKPSGEAIGFSESYQKREEGEPGTKPTPAKTPIKTPPKAPQDEGGREIKICSVCKEYPIDCSILHTDEDTICRIMCSECAEAYQAVKKPCPKCKEPIDHIQKKSKGTKM